MRVRAPWESRPLTSSQALSQTEGRAPLPAVSKDRDREAATGKTNQTIVYIHREQKGSDKIAGLGYF